MLTEVFWTFVISTGATVVGLAIRSCLKANIDEMSFCGGLMKVHRVIRLDDIQAGSDDGSSPSLRLTPLNKSADVKL